MCTSSDVGALSGTVRSVVREIASQVHDGKQMLTGVG